MRTAWLRTLRSGLARRSLEDRLRPKETFSIQWSPWRCLLPYCRRHRGAALWGMLMVGLSVPAGLATPLISLCLVDYVILARRLDSLVLVVIGLALCLGVEKVLRLAEDFCFARFEQRVAQSHACAWSRTCGENFARSHGYDVMPDSGLGAESARGHSDSNRSIRVGGLPARRYRRRDGRHVQRQTD